MTKDTYSVWFMLTASLLFFSTFFTVMFNMSFLWEAFLSILSIIWMLVFFIELASSFYRRKWRRAVSIIVAPLLVCCFVGGWRSTELSTDVLRLLLWQRSYFTDIATHPSGPKGQRFILWDWGQHTAGLDSTVSLFQALVYDSSDQIALPRTMRTSEWEKFVDASGYQGQFLIRPESVEQAELFDQNMKVQHLIGHFYVCNWII